MLYLPPTGATDPDAHYVGKNTAAGTNGSKVPAGAVENPQRELQALIVEGGLSPTNDDLRQGLKAIRGGKLWTFPDVGTVNAIVISTTTAHTTLFRGLPFTVFPASTNTGEVSFTVTAPGAGTLTAALRRRDGSVMKAGDVIAGIPLDVIYDGSLFRSKAYTASEIRTDQITVQNFNPDLVYDANAAANYQAVYAGTDLGTFTLPAGYASIRVDAASYVDGGTVATDLYLAHWFNANDGSGWILKESQRATKPAGARTPISRPMQMILNRAKSYSFSVRMLKDTDTMGATAVSGNVLALAQSI